MEPLLGGNELYYVVDCIKTNWISSQGKYVSDFENNFAQYHSVCYALTTSNGTTALHLALTALGVGPGDKVCLKIYHIKSQQRIKKIELTEKTSCNAIKICHGKYEQFWIMNTISKNCDDDFSSYAQTNDIFHNVQTFMVNNDLTLINNAIRTWIYVHDIDNHYAGMVNARRNFFDKAGLTSETRFIASQALREDMQIHVAW